MLSSTSQCSRPQQSLTPKADVYTNDEQMLILIDMPGVSKTDLDVTFKQGRLWVEGTHSSGKQPIRSRAFRISDQYEPNQTNASIEQGVVRLEIPKRPEAKTVRIPINAA
tara:strand:- start:300 stop:629 length:330 start_codon:yes stop_codon:yes gene_type:complete